MTPQFKMGKAKAALILEQPFHASILCNLPMIEDATLTPPTMATNGSYVKYHPEFVTECSMDELKFVLCHEVMHCVFQHMFRRGERNPKRWNSAGDYIINDLLITENIGMMPKNGLHNSALVQAGGGTTEGVYDLLPEGDDGNGGDEPMDTCEDAGGSQADMSAAEAQMKVMVAQAAQAAKMMGKLSAGMQRFIDAALQPKVDWRDVLRRFVASKAKVDPSFARPKRRFACEDFILPSLQGEQLGTIVVAVDTSGSIGSAELAEFAAEMSAIKADMQPERMEVVYFDSEVVHHDTFERDQELHVEPHGGGGTAFSPVIDFIYERDLDPTCCVFLTDLRCSDFGEPPHFPVLWVSTHSGSAPWGEIVYMNPKM